MDLLLAPFRFVYNLVGGVVSVILLIFCVVMFIDCLTSKAGKSEKIAWLLVIVFGNVLGSLLYLFLGRRKSR